MTNSTITTSEIAVVDTPVVETPNNEAKKPVIKTNKDFRAHMAAKALDFGAIAEEAQRVKLEKNPEVKLDEMSRKERFGEVGMAAQTHMRMNAALSGFSDAELRIFKEMNVDPMVLANDSKSGGLTREDKKYVIAICASIAQDCMPADVDFAKINEALKKIDPSAPRMTRAHNAIRNIIELLCDVKSWTARHYSVTFNQDTDRQGTGTANFLGRVRMAKVSGRGATALVTPDQDHPVVKALIALGNKYLIG